MHFFLVSVISVKDCYLVNNIRSSKSNYCSIQAFDPFIKKNREKF